jgi:hypothetical protein
MRFPPTLKSVIILSTLVIATGCAVENDPNEFKGCVSSVESDIVANDQMGTFIRRLSPLTSTLVVDNTFDNDAKKIIEEAAATWNKLSQSVFKQDLFIVTYADIPEGAMPNTATSCGGALPTGHRYVLREKSQDHWTSLGKSGLNPGATIRCYGTNMPEQGIILINMENLLTPQHLIGVILHEMGHLIGLDHSCADGLHPEMGPSGALKCSDLASTHPYRVAIMNPSLEGQIKSVLGTNDEQRLACLYGRR